MSVPTRSAARLVVAGFSLLLLSGLVSTVSATVLWRGSFEDGTRSEFARYHAVEADPPRISVVPKPVADGFNVVGARAARVELRTNDDARKLDPATGAQIGSNDYNERSELMVPSRLFGHDNFREGDDVWMSWQSMFPADDWWGLDPKGGGTIFFQIHHVLMTIDTYSGSPPLMFIADNETLSISQCLVFPCSGSTDRYSEPLRRDHWYTFVLHAKHSSDASKGKLEVWIDGVKRVDLNTALLFGPDFGNYVLTGQYRRPGTIHDAVVFADNYVVATSPDDVMSATPSDPAPSDPAPSDPAPSDPAPSDPAPSDPAPSDPAPSDPAPSDPAPSDPAPSDPAPSDPAPSDPAPSDPAPSDPAPSEPDGAAVETASPAQGCSQAGASLLAALACGGLLLSRRRIRR